MTWARFLLFAVFLSMAAYTIASPAHGEGFCQSEVEFSCLSNGQRNCYPETWKCDGEPDCDGAVDEEGCPPISCLADEFQCDNTCYPQSYNCDGIHDCSDSSDELSCPNPPSEV